MIASVLDRYELIKVPTDVYQVSHMPFTVLPLDFALVVGGGAAHLLLRHDLSVAPGGAPRSGAGVEIRVEGTDDDDRLLEVYGIVKSYPLGGCR